MSDTRSTGIGEFRGDIEGLRALAVVLVVLFHAEVPWLDGGFVGVDVFFVISGFLITRLLLLECVRTQSLSLRQFWARRVRRLLPNAALTLLTVAAFGFFFLDPVSMQQAGKDVTAAALFVANFWFRSRANDYFDEDADRSGVLHFWSLSVEEQYYLLWPPLLAAFLVMQLRAKHSLPVIFRRAFVILSVCAALSFGWFVKNAIASPIVGYYATQARLWELAAGGLIAFSLHGGYGGPLRS
ncbi:MAG TPA: acyltransferase, partial [Polyangiaceae bacterium]|nr:acyltransferase [Polyangiaceae bacterium]